MLQSAITDDDPQRDADEIGVGELHAGAGVAIVQQHVDSRSQEFLVDSRRLGYDLLAVVVELQHLGFEGRNINRQDTARLVTAGLDRRRQDAIDADAVAPHDARLLPAVLVQEGRAKLLAVFRAELEDVSNFDTPFEYQLLSVVRVAVDGVAYVGHDNVVSGEREVAPGHHVSRVVVCLVGAGDAGGHGCDGVVDNQLDILILRQSNRAGETDGCTGYRLYVFRINQSYLFAENAAQFGVVNLVVSPDNDNVDAISSGGVQRSPFGMVGVAVPVCC